MPGSTGEAASRAQKLRLIQRDAFKIAVVAKAPDLRNDRQIRPGGKLTRQDGGSAGDKLCANLEGW